MESVFFTFPYLISNNYIDEMKTAVQVTETI